MYVYMCIKHDSNSLIKKMTKNLNPIFLWTYYIFVEKKYTIDQFIYLIVNILYFKNKK